MQLSFKYQPLVKIVINKIVYIIIRFYQLFISPLTPPTCRFLPSCSCYMYQALITHGLLKGGYLGLKRLFKCRPYGPSGLDFVPPKTTKLT
jgi:putative membrane protein insertion efficiency factor